MSTPVAARLAWPDAARGLAIVLVVLHHAIQDAGEVSMAVPPWDWLSELLRTMRMPLFFLAAGLFAGKWADAPWRDLVRAKVMLFAWVFVLWTVLRWGIYNLVPRTSVESGWENLFEHLWWPLAGWFLVALAVFFVVLRLTRKIDPRIQLGVALGVSIVWFGGSVEIGNHAWDGLFLYYVFFLVGCYGRGLITAAVDAHRWWAGAAVVAAWPVLFAGLVMVGLQDAPVFSFVLRVVGVAAGVVLAVWLSRLSWLRSLGQRTLAVYVVHSAVVYVVVSAALAIGAPQWAGVGWWMPPAVAAVALAVSLAVGEVAPRVKAAWLFDTPRWLRRAYDRVTVTRSEPVRAAPGRAE